MAEIDTQDTTALPVDPAVDPVTPPAPTEEARFTQADMDRAISDRLQRERGKSKGKKSKPPRAVEPAAEPVSSRQFDRHLGRANLEPAQESMLEMLWERVPDGTDPSEWIPAQCAQLKWADPPTVEPSVTPPVVPPVAPVVPASNGGAPASPAARYTDGDNPLEWTRDQMDRIRADKGVAKGNAYIRERYEQYLTNVTVKL